MKRDLDGYPELLEDLFDKIVDLLEERGLPRGVADETAFAVSEFFRCERAGRILYTRKKLQAPEVDPQDGLFEAAQIERKTVGDDPTKEHLDQVIDRAAAALARLDIDPNEAQAHGRAIADFLRLDWEGESVYIPKGLGYRNYTIWRDWDGSYGSKIRLMQKHGIGEVRFYQIVAAYRERHRRRTQPMLPGMNEAV